MFVSTLGRNRTNVMAVVHNSHEVLISKDMSVSTLGRNPTDVIPVDDSSHKVVT